MTRTPPSPDVLKNHVPKLESIEECLATGGFKWVYKVIIQGRVEALKVVEIRQIDDSDDDAVDAFTKEQADRIRREIDVLSQCETKGIVKLGEIPPTEFTIGETHYLAYSEEFLDGINLWDQIHSQERKPPDLGELILLTLSLLRCIEELWQRGYVHRDIKPHNVMKTGLQERPFVLLDLGIAFAIHDTNLTFRPGERMPVATYRYLAPEMMQPDFRDRIDYRTDLYAAGMTIYEFAAAKHPLAENEQDLMRTSMHNLIKFTVADLDLPKTQPEILAAKAIEMYDGKKPVQTLEVAKATGKHYHTVKTHLHRAGRLGLLKCVPRKGWLPPSNA